MNFALFMVYASIYVGLVATSFYILSFDSDKKKPKPLFKDNELPTVSIIIPAFNEEKSIARTIESAIKADYPKGKIEIIVVDDGSKDRTYEIAKKYISSTVKVLTKPNGGKGTALNLGIKKARGEIIFSMDADTFISPHSVKGMARYFKNPEVMSVAPSMLVYQPKGILQRIQQGEYLFGLFIRKAFASLNAIYVTPGAFSAYRKSFFEKHGGYAEGNITEDLEMALRIQFNGYRIEYSPESPAYTIAPNKFKQVMIQRRRWYVGLMRNIVTYKKMFSRKYGDLGMFVMPIAWISIFFSLFAVFYFLYNFFRTIRDELTFLIKVNFDFSNLFQMNWYIFERFVFQVLTNPITVFFIFYLIAISIFIKFATAKVGKVKGMPLAILFNVLFFVLLFGFWWIVSIVHVLLGKKITWR